ncbi:WD40-repeat-containing domain protein [Trametes punicea]|nr:WD40-repeat-containing domain protein [Trametes punicea]
MFTLEFLDRKAQHQMEGVMQHVHSDYTAWAPPAYDMTRTPKEVHSYQLNDERGLDEYASKDPSVFARMAKWCPDGSAALAQCEDRTFRFLQLPAELLGMTADPMLQASLPRSLMQSAPILDYAWYPGASIRDTRSFCFVASVRECPVRLLDASDGRLRACYKIVDHRERQVAPHSLAFNVNANRLYCGFEDAIEIFDIHYPGEGNRLHTTPSKKSRDGLKGIISALAFCPDMSSGMYAAGSLSPSSPSSSNIAIFSEETGEVPIMFVGAEGSKHEVGYGARASVSQLMFNPARPYLLYASFRRMASIYCWDLRADVSRAVEVLNREGLPISGNERQAATNQRLRFDIDYGGRWLSTGDQDGGISVFDLAAHPESALAENAPQPGSTPRTTPIMQFNGHRDAVGSVAFHPVRPLLLSVSGSRHFDAATPMSGQPTDSSSSDSDGNDILETEGGDANSAKLRKLTAISMPRRRPQPIALDASIKLWDFSAQ